MMYCIGTRFGNSNIISNSIEEMMGQNVGNIEVALKWFTIISGGGGINVLHVLETVVLF